MVLADPANAVVTIPDDYLLAIGKVCVQWGNLEAIMELTIAKLASMDIWDARSKIVLNHMAWPMRMDIFTSLANHLMADYPRLERVSDSSDPPKKSPERPQSHCAQPLGF